MVPSRTATGNGEQDYTTDLKYTAEHLFDKKVGGDFDFQRHACETAALPTVTASVAARLAAEQGKALKYVTCHRRTLT